MSIRLLAILPLCLMSLAAAGADHPTQTGTPRRVLAADYQKKRIALVRADNTVAWEQPIRDVHDLHVLANGNILFQTTFQDVVEVDPQGKMVWKYEAKPAAGERVEIHAFQRLADGLTMIAESGRGRIIEVDAAGKIVKTIVLKRDHPDAHRDTRLVRKLSNGHYLAAQEGDLAVREYDGDGKVVWEYDAGKRLYSAIRLENGNTLLGMGDGHSVIEVDPTGKTVWSIGENELPGIQLAWITMVERLPNGNTFIVNCHAGPENPQLIEVAPDKKVVWKFKDFERFGNSLPVARVLD